MQKRNGKSHNHKASYSNPASNQAARSQQIMQAQAMKENFEAEFQKILESELFPDDKIPFKWFQEAKSALQHASPLSLGVSGPDLAKLINIKKDEINLYQFAILSNNLESKTAWELRMTPPEYAEMIVMAHELSTEWNRITKELREQANARMEAKLEEYLNQHAPGNNGLSAVN